MDALEVVSTILNSGNVLACFTALQILSLPSIIKMPLLFVTVNCSPDGSCRWIMLLTFKNH